MSFFSDSVPRAGKTYILAIVVAGLPVLLWSLYYSFIHFDPQWLMLATLTSVGSFFPVYLPVGKGKNRGVAVTISDIFIFTAVPLFGPEVAVAVAGIDAILGNFRARHHITHFYKLLFNVAQLSLVTFLVGKLFYALQKQPAPLRPESVDNTLGLVINVGFCSLLYFLFNSGAVAVAICLVTRKPLVEIWRQNFLWASLTNFAGVSAAAVIFLNFDHTQFLAIGTTIPIVLVIYSAYRMHLNQLSKAQEHLDHLNSLFHSTIAALALAIDAKDQCTHGHLHRVQALALGLARRCGIDDEKELEGLRAAALLHDVGKLAVPEYILNKPSSLTSAEMQKMRSHAVVGANILATVPFPYPVVPAVRHHHEKWDGTGYPDGLRGEEIPLAARILSVVDCYDALRSDRPYRPRLGREVVLRYLQAEAGKSYDPAVVEVLMRDIDELEARLGTPESQISPCTLRMIGNMGLDGDEQRNIRRTAFHDIASSYRDVGAITEISQIVGKTMTVADTLKLLAETIRSHVPYDACAVYLLNSNKDKVIPYYTVGEHQKILDGIEIKIGVGLTGWVAANNQPIVNGSPAADFGNVEVLRSGFQSSLSVPLSMEQGVVGAITLYSKGTKAYDLDHLRLMEMVSLYSAVAINNAILYEDKQEDAYTDVLTGLPHRAASFPQDSTKLDASLSLADQTMYWNKVARSKRPALRAARLR